MIWAWLYLGLQLLAAGLHRVVRIVALVSRMFLGGVLAVLFCAAIFGGFAALCWPFLVLHLWLEVLAAPAAILAQIVWGIFFVGALISLDDGPGAPPCPR